MTPEELPEPDDPNFDRRDEGGDADEEDIVDGFDLEGSQDQVLDELEEEEQEGVLEEEESRKEEERPKKHPAEEVIVDKSVKFHDDDDHRLEYDNEVKPHFTTREFGDTKIKLHDVRDSDGFFSGCRPLQWFAGNTLHREKRPRKVSWDELFLDLIFIASVSRSETYIKNSNPTLTQLNHFALTFTLIWMHWLTTHYHANKFATNDLYHKMYTWWMMILMAGLGINAQNAFGDNATVGQTNTANNFIVTFLIGRVLYIFSHCRLFYGAPEFSTSVALMLSSNIISAIPYLVSVFVSSEHRVALWWSAFLTEQVLYNLNILLARYILPPKHFFYRLAVNIEHHSERFGLLTLMVLGEVVIALVWDSTSPQFSWNYAATILGLIIAICLQWVYYNVDGSSLYTHALRRSVVTAILWQQFHYPLHLAAVAAGAALSMMIVQAATSPFSPPTAALRIIFCGGFTIAMLCIAFIGMTHKSHEHQARRQTKMMKKSRTIGRMCVAGIIALLGGVGGDLGAVTLVAIVAVAVLFETVLEEWGRLKVTKSAKAVVKVEGEGHHHGHAHGFSKDRWEEVGENEKH